jgi:micrococcal nuclease
VRRRVPRPWWPRRTRQRVAAVALPVSLAALTALLVLLLAPITGNGEPPDDAPTTLPVPATFHRTDTDTMVRARVLDVIDGDTIDVMVDGAQERVRYFGVDTPERGQHCYEEAKRRNQEMVGDEVFLMADVRDRDKNGRLLRYVFASDGVLVDASLVAEGLGVAWRDDGVFRDDLVDLEAESRDLDIGCLWGTN